MESDSWSRFSKRHQNPALQSRFDLYLGLDEVEAGGGEDESRVEYGCPFCSEDFDVVGLCCHIEDEHPVEAKNGVCPVCATRVGLDLVGHITTRHGSVFKVQRKRRSRKLSSGSTLSLFRKDLREGNLQSFLGGSSYATAPCNVTADPLLSSFILNFPVGDSQKDVQPEPSDDGSAIQNSSDEKLTESETSLSDDEDREERARRSTFVQGLVLSTIFDDVF